jgi:hypothetical protein
MIGYGLQYYLARDMPNGVPVPRELFVAETAARAATLYPVPGKHPAACLGTEARIRIIGSGYASCPEADSSVNQRSQSGHNFS